MAVLRVDHPDIREFVTCKASEKSITNFNISVGITDKFMVAVREDTDFELVAPHTKEVVEKVRARELFDLIVKYAHHNGEPGVLFLDAANRYNPVPHLYELEATNPCGMMPSLPLSLPLSISLFLSLSPSSVLSLLFSSLPCSSLC